MNILLAFVIAFTLFAASRALLRYRSKDISLSELLFWAIIWISVALITAAPQTSDFIARLAGIKRGTDVAFFVSIVLLFYLLFRVYVKIEHLDRDLTDVVIKLANKDKETKAK